MYDDVLDDGGALVDGRALVCCTWSVDGGIKCTFAVTVESF